MRQTAIFPGRYLQAPDALQHLGAELARLGRRAFFIAGRTAASSLIPAHENAWRAHLDLHVEPFHGECSDPEIERLSALAHGYPLVVAMGGGKAIDTAKAVGDAVSAKVAIVPTIASTDAPTSAVSVVYTPAGAFSRYLFFPRNPDLVLVDTSVIAGAPVRYLIAGMGDGLSTWFEADACRQSYSHNQCGGLATIAAQNLARLCYDTLLQDGFAAKLACEQRVVTPALSRVIEANTLLSGLGFESGGLASAHSIHNGLTMLHDTHAFYHGEKVAIGVLAGLFLAGRDHRQIDEVFLFCESVGLPTTLAQIGLSSVTDHDLHIVAARACAEGETIHHEPSPVDAARVFAALKAADAYGRARLGRANAHFTR